jgi:hypothetical protein
VLSAVRRPRDKYWLARFGDAGRGCVKKKLQVQFIRKPEVQFTPRIQTSYC